MRSSISDALFRVIKYRTTSENFVVARAIPENVLVLKHLGAMHVRRGHHDSETSDLALRTFSAETSKIPTFFARL